MPRAYPVEFRRRAIALVTAGNTVAKTAADLGVTETAIYNWLKQEKIDSGLLPGLKSGEARELVRARRRIRELEAEVSNAPQDGCAIAGLRRIDVLTPPDGLVACCSLRGPC